MITLLHGDDVEASRNELNRFKSQAKQKEIRHLDWREVSDTALTQALESQSLFGVETVVIIENLFTRLGRKTKSIEELVRILRQGSKGSNVILWEEKTIGTGIVESLGTDAQVKLFKIPAIIFQFLDGLRPGNAKPLLLLYRKVTRKDAPELVFAMLVRRLRQLMIVHDGSTVSGLQPWQVNRLTSQAKSFTMEKLVAMYRKLLTIEYSVKSGTSPFTLSAHIEQFLADL